MRNIGRIRCIYYIFIFWNLNCLLENNGDTDVAYKLACERNGSKIENKEFKKAIEYYSGEKKWFTFHQS